MFEHLQDHRIILAVGLHRAGTKILAAMIQHDVGRHMLLFEAAFGDGSVPRFEALMYEDEFPKVIQCPFMLNRIHFYPEAMVVFVHRDLDDICASMGRQSFMPNWIRREHDAYHTDRDVFEVKLECWEEQKKLLPHVQEVRYEDLAQHPLWVPPEIRVRKGYREIECLSNVST